MRATSRRRVGGLDGFAEVEGFKIVIEDSRSCPYTMISEELSLSNQDMRKRMYVRLGKVRRSPGSPSVIRTPTSVVPSDEVIGCMQS